MPLLKDAFVYTRDGPTTVHANQRNQKWITPKQVVFLESFVLEELSEYISLHDPVAESLRTDIRALSKLFDFRRQFHLFRNLPPEIRAMVWGYATHPKFVSVSNNRLTKYGYPRSTPPITAQVCRESRAVACHHGRLVPVRDPYSLPLNPIPPESETPESETPESDYEDETSQSSFDEESQPDPNPNRSMNNWGWFDPSRDSLIVSDYPPNIPKVIAQCVQNITLDYTSMGMNFGRLHIFHNADAFPQLKVIDHIAYRFRVPEFRDPIFEARLFGSSASTPVTINVDDFDALVQRLGADHSSHELDRLRRLGLDISISNLSNAKAIQQTIHPRIQPGRDGKSSGPIFRRVVRFDLGHEGSEDWH